MDIQQLEIEELSFDEALASYRNEWFELVANKGEDPCCFPEWIIAIADSSDARGRLRVWVARWEGAVVSMIPYYLSRVQIYGIWLNTVELAGNFISYHQEVLATESLKDCIKAFLTSLPANSWDLFKMDNVVMGGASWSSLQQIADVDYPPMVLHATVSSPVLFIDTDWDAYLAARSRSFRYRLRRKAKGIAKAGKVEMKWLNEPEDVPEVLEAMLAIESRSWKAAEETAISESKREIEYYKKLLPFLAQSDMTFANVLYLDGEAIAYSLCYKFRGRIAQLKTSFDDRYSKISPGTYVIDVAIERAFHEKASEFDFLGDVMPHKLDWSKEVRAHHCLYLFNNTWKGKATSFGKKVVEKLRKNN